VSHIGDQWKELYEAEEIFEHKMLNKNY